METSDMETEIKLELLADDPLAVLTGRLGKPSRKAEQLNRYFLPAAPLGWVVRFREEDGALVLTVKGPTVSRAEAAASRGTQHHADNRTTAGMVGNGLAPGTAGLFVRTEREHKVAPEMLLHLLPGADQASLFALAPMAGLTGPLRPAGSCRNTRWCFPHAGFMLELDRTEYPDGSIGWELEIESDRPADALAAASRLLGDLAIPFRPAAKGKFARTLERLGAPVYC